MRQIKIVKLKNMSIEEYFSSSDEAKETIDLYYGEEGIAITKDDNFTKVAFPNSNMFEYIKNEFLEEVEQHVSVELHSVEEEVVKIKVYFDKGRASKEVFEYENRDGIDKNAYITTIE